jgi:hypothetical protein
MKLKDYLILKTHEFGLKKAYIEKYTGIKIHNLQKFPSHYTGPSLKDLLDVLSLNEIEVYSKFKYLPKECIELLFDERHLRFFLWLCHADTPTREEIFKILDRLIEVGSVRPDPPELPAIQTHQESEPDDPKEQTDLLTPHLKDS